MYPWLPQLHAAPAPHMGGSRRAPHTTGRTRTPALLLLTLFLFHLLSPDPPEGQTSGVNRAKIACATPNQGGEERPACWWESRHRRSQERAGAGDGATTVMEPTVVEEGRNGGAVFPSPSPLNPRWWRLLRSQSARRAGRDGGKVARAAPRALGRVLSAHQRVQPPRRPTGTDPTPVHPSSTSQCLTTRSSPPLRWRC
jgi:hypothetical protein